MQKQTRKTVPIYVHGRPLSSIFELLGSTENNITFSVGWALANAPSFLSRFSEGLGISSGAFNEVRLQEAGKDGGYTDIELLGDNAHAIVEAKKGWWLPTDLQFERYAPRFALAGRSEHVFVAMSDCSPTYAGIHLPDRVAGVKLRYFGWRDVEALTGAAVGPIERRLLAELRTYLRTVATMQDPRSNLVYVVSLSRDPVRPGCPYTYVDVVEKLGKYFHPVGKGYPKEPPNYMGFRYNGKLQSIHHVDSFTVVADPVVAVPDCEGVGPHQGTPHYVYQLGPAIAPQRPVRSGAGIQSRRVWAAIDLLLTSETVLEADEKTRARLATDSGSEFYDS